MTNRLATIATAQKKTLTRDALFACLIALFAAIGFASVTTAANGASTQIVQR
jgi:hypothetical protein